MKKNEKTEQWIEALMIGGGIVLGIEVIRHRKLVICAGVCAAAAMGVRRILNDLTPPSGRARQTKHLNLGSPSFPGEHVSKSTQEPMDEIDEAMMESFPASDPPASYHRSV